MATSTLPARWQYGIAALFVLGFLAGLYGVVFAPSQQSTFLTVLIISAGGLLLAFTAQRLSGFSIGLEGVEAKLGEVEDKVDDLKKLQVEMAYQLNRDLLSKRFEAYGDLWSRMHDTAIYTTTGFSPTEATDLLKKLSEWYFSATGGILLTTRARDFYFSLQDLVRAVGGLSDWKCDQRPSQPRMVFARLLRDLDLKDQQLVEQVDLVLQGQAELLDSAKWRLVCGSIADKLVSLVNSSNEEAGEVIYAAIQQVASVLRTNLAYELRSRLDVEWPTAR
jgi:hypothetical protein